MKSNIRDFDAPAPADDLIRLPQGPISKFQVEHNAPLKKFPSAACPVVEAEQSEPYDPVAAARAVRDETARREREKTEKLHAFQVRLKHRVRSAVAAAKRAESVRASELETRTKSLLGLSSLDLSGVTPVATSKRPKILSDTFILQGVGEDAEDVTQTLTERAAKAKVASHSARRSLLAHASLVEEAHSIVQSKVIFADGSSLTEDVPVIETVEAKAAKSSLSDQTSFLEASQRDHAYVFGTVREAAAKASRLSARSHRQEAQKRKEALRRQKAEAEAAERAAKEQFALEEAEKQRLAQEAALAAEASRRQEFPASQSPNERRATEAKRFLEALRKQVISRVEAAGVSLPRLCTCSPHLPLLAPHWEHCANNCLYYRNPKAYTQALSDLFQSLNLM